MKNERFQQLKIKVSNTLVNSLTCNGASGARLSQTFMDSRRIAMHCSTFSAHCENRLNENRKLYVFTKTMLKKFNL